MIFTLPNFGEAPAVQVSSAKATLKVDLSTLKQVEAALQTAGVTPDTLGLEGNSVRAGSPRPTSSSRAKDAIEKALITDPHRPDVYRGAEPELPHPRLALGPGGPTHVPGAGPARRRALHAAGGHGGALTKRNPWRVTAPHCATRHPPWRHHRDGQTVKSVLRDEADAQNTVRNLITDQLPDLQVVLGGWRRQRIRASIKPEALRKVQEQALKTNITHPATTGSTSWAWPSR